MLLAHGPLRDGLTADDAAATYSALSNPSTYALLTAERGWNPGKFEHARRQPGSRAKDTDPERLELTTLHSSNASGCPQGAVPQAT